MNVVYVLNTTYLFGGSVRSFLSMLYGLMERGVNPIVVLPDDDGVCRVLREKGIETIVLCFRPNTYPHNRTTLKDIFLFFPKLVARRVVNYRAVVRLTKLLRGRNIDLIHTNVSVIDVGMRASQKLGVPHLFHIREYGFLDFHEIYYPWPKAFRALMHKSYTICITKHIQQSHGLMGNEKARVIYNGIDVPKIELSKLRKEGYFLYAGCIDPSKGLHVLLEAYANYLLSSALNYELWIAGDVNDYSYYEKVKLFIKSHDIAKKVKFLGSREDVFKLMQGAEAVVIPSRFEGFGRCMAEAMMNGCLVVAHNTAGLKELFDNGVEMSGREIGFRYETMEELSRCLLQVDALDDVRMKQYLSCAYKVARGLYTPRVNVEKVFQFYEDIVHEGKG